MVQVVAHARGPLVVMTGGADKGAPPMDIF
jgi:hypothetical protein